jgi:hypothetical protein
VVDGPGCVHRRRQSARRLIIRARSVRAVRHGRANTERQRGDSAATAASIRIFVVVIVNLRLLAAGCGN